MKGEHFINQYPLEELLPTPSEEEIQEIVNNCDYTYEANMICEKDDIDNMVNIADAIVFYDMGYKAAQDRINRILKPNK